MMPAALIIRTLAWKDSKSRTTCSARMSSMSISRRLVWINRQHLLCHQSAIGHLTQIECLVWTLPFHLLDLSNFVFIERLKQKL